MPIKPITIKKGQALDKVISHRHTKFQPFTSNIYNYGVTKIT